MKGEIKNAYKRCYRKVYRISKFVIIFLVSIPLIAFTVFLFTFFLKRNWFKKILLPLTILSLLSLGATVLFFGVFRPQQAITFSGIPFYQQSEFLFEEEKLIRPSDFDFDDGGAGDLPVDLYIAGLNNERHLYNDSKKLLELIDSRRREPLAEMTYLANVQKKSGNNSSDEIRTKPEYITATIPASDIERLALMEAYHQTLDEIEEAVKHFLEEGK